MSDRASPRRTLVEAKFNGVSISDALAKYLLSFTYVDCEEDESDEIQIKLQDRNSVWLDQWLEECIDAATNDKVSEPVEEEEEETEEVVEEAAPPVKAVVGNVCTVNVNTVLNIRDGPNGSVLTQYSRGVEVTVLKTEGNWSQIVYGDGTAWCYSSYLTPTGDTYALVSPDVSQPVETAGVPDPSLEGLSDEELAEAETPSIDQSTGLVISANIVRANWKSDGKDDLLECGTFSVDSIAASGPPSVITIKAVSLPYSTQIRQTKKTKAWENYDLMGIANEIAGKNSLKVMSLLSSPPSYERVEQYQLSDIEFLEKLCHDAGISLKVTNSMIVLFDQAQYEAQAMANKLNISKGDGSYVSYSLSYGSADTKYKSCRVSYVDPDTAVSIEGIAYVDDYDAEKEQKAIESATEKGELYDIQQLEVTAKVKSIGEAQALARKNLRLANKYQKDCSFTMIGDPVYLAGVGVSLSGFGSFDGNYIIRQATHSVSGGYTVKIELRPVLNGV